MYQATNNSTSKQDERARTRMVTMMICALVFIALVLGFLFLGTRDNKSATAGHTQADSMFSFGGAEGWHKGPTTATSMALFSPSDHSGISPCLLTAEYYVGKVNSDDLQAQNLQTLQSNNKVVAKIADVSTSIQTSEGTKNFTFHRYNVAKPAGQESPVMGGNELGFVQLKKGYLKLSGRCDTTDQLPSTLPALAALKFDATALKH